jgi:energy-converting hydrogenase Eha subunit C
MKHQAIKSWYAVRCLFRFPDVPGQRKKRLYEERITLWQADDIDKAIGLAEQEAALYVADCGCAYLKVAQAFALFDPVISQGTEVFSLFRESNKKSNAYLDHFFTTGFERGRLS